MKKLVVLFATFLLLLSLTACGGEVLREESKSSIDDALNQYESSSLGLVTSIRSESDDYKVFSVTVDSDLWYDLSSSETRQIAKTLAGNITEARQSQSQSRVAVSILLYDSSGNKIAEVSPTGNYSEN